MAKGKKMGAMPVWKIVLLTIAAFVGLVGVAALAGFLLSNDDDVFPTEGIYFVDDNGQGFNASSDFSMTISANEIQSGDSEDEEETVVEVTAKKITLSLNDVGYGTARDGEYITNHVIRVKENVLLDEPFTVYLESYLDNTYNKQYIRGGSSIITARSEYAIIETISTTVYVDVPAYEFSTYAYDSVAGKEAKYKANEDGEIEIIEDATFKLGFDFYPKLGRYLYSNTSEDYEKMIAYSWTGTNVNNDNFFDYNTRTFRALEEKDTYTIDVYVFKSAHDQEDFLAKFIEKYNGDGELSNFELVNREMLDYFGRNPNSFEKATAKIKVTAVTVDSFSIANKSFDQGIVDKYFNLSSNSTDTAFDATLGVDIRDSENMPLNSVHARNVGIAVITSTVTNPDLAVRIVGGGYVMKVVETISEEGAKPTYQVTREVYSTETAKAGGYNYTTTTNEQGETVNTLYYILPDSTTSKEASYYSYKIASERAGTIEFSSVLFIQSGTEWSIFFKSGQNSIDDLGAKFSIQFSVQAETAIAWKENYNSAIVLEYDTDTHQSSSINLSEQIAVDLGNMYQTVKYFIYFSDGTAPDGFSAISTKTPPVRYVVGTDITYITGLNSGENVYLYELTTPVLKAVGQYTGNLNINVIAAIVKENVDGEIVNSEGGIYKAGDKYVFISQTMNRGITISSTIPYSSFSATLEFSSSEEHYFNAGVEIGSGIYVPSELYTSAAASDSFTYRIYVDVQDDETVKSSMQDTLVQMVKEGSLNIIFDAANDAGRMLTLDTDTVTTGETASSGIPGYVRVYVSGNVIVSSEFYSVDGVKFTARLYYNNGNLAQNTKSVGYYYEDAEVGQDGVGFTLYTQVADATNTEFLFEEVATIKNEYDTNLPIEVSVSASTGTHIEWTSKELNLTDKTPIEMLNELIGLDVRDQLDRKILTSVASYSISQSSFTNREGEDVPYAGYNIATALEDKMVKILSFPSTGGNAVKTIMTFVITYKSSASATATFNYSKTLTFNIKSEGIEAVVYDTTDVATPEETQYAIVPSDGYGSIKISKKVTDRDELYLNSLFKVITSSSNADDLNIEDMLQEESALNNISVKDLVFKIDTSGYSESNLNALFAYHSEDIEGDGGTGASDSMLDLMTITDGMGNTKKINYNSEESVDVIKILYPFYVRTVLNFIVTDAYNIVNLRFQLIFEPNVTVRNRLSNYAAEMGFDDYLSGNDNYPYAIPVFSGTAMSIPLDTYFSLHYLSLPENSNQISWSNADESFAVISANNDFVSINIIAGKACLRFTSFDGAREVASQEVVTIKIYFKSPELASYAFSMDLTFVINPDLLVVLKDDYIDLAELNSSSGKLALSNYFSVFRATDYVLSSGNANPISITAICTGIGENPLAPIKIDYEAGIGEYICRDTNGSGLTFDGLGKESKVKISFEYSSNLAEFVLINLMKSSSDIEAGVDSFEMRVGYGKTPEETIAYLFNFGDEAEKTDKNNVELTKTSDGIYMLLLSAGQGEQYYLNNDINDVFEGENKENSIITMADEERFIIKAFNEFTYDSTIVFSILVKGESSSAARIADTIKLPVRFIIVGVSFSKYTDFVGGAEKVKEDYAYDIITSEKPEDLEENDYYQELVAGADYNVVNVISETTGPETFAHTWGITYKDPNDNSLSSVLSVYKIDGGYEGLVNIVNNTQISIKPFTAQEGEECVYAILLLRLNRAIAGTIRYYNVYYRIKIIPNYQLGGVSYPYYNTDVGDEFGEYLKGDQFEIPLEEGFGVHNSSNSVFGDVEDSRFKELVDTDGNVVTSDIRKEYTYSAKLTDTGVPIDLETYFDAYTVIANGVLVLRLKERYASTPITFVITRMLYRGDDFVYNSEQSYTIYLNNTVEYISELDALVEKPTETEGYETEKVRQTADENGEYNIDLSVNQTYQYELSVFERTGNIDVPQLGLNAHILNDDAVNYIIKANAPYATSLDQFVDEGELKFYTQDITIINFKISDENPFIVEYEFTDDEGITEIRYTPTTNIFVFDKNTVFIANFSSNKVVLGQAEIQSVDKDNVTYYSAEIGAHDAQTKKLQYYVEGEMRYVNFNIMANQSEEDIEGFDKVYTGLGVVDGRIGSTNQVLGDAVNAYSTSYGSFSFVTKNILRVENSSQGTFYINKDYRNTLLNCVNFRLVSEMQMPGQEPGGNANAYSLSISVVDSISKDETFSVGVYNKYGDIVVINYTIKGRYDISLGSENVPYKWTSGNTYALSMFINVTEKLGTSGDFGADAISKFEYAAEGPNAKYISFGTLFGNSINVAFTKEDFEVTIVATEKENQSLGDGQYSRYKYSFRFTISFKAGFNSVVVRNYPERVEDILSVYSQQTFEINVDKDDITNADKSDIYRKYLYSIMNRKAYNAIAQETPIEGQDAEQLNKDFFRFVDDAELGDGTIDDTTYRKTDSVTAEDVSDVETKQIVHKLGYFFNGNLIFTFNVNYSYRIMPNVDVKHHYPILVNNVAQAEVGEEKTTDIEMQEEYVDGVTLDGEGTTIVNFFNTKASFTSGNDNRITVNLAEGVSESLDINYNISIAISDSRNATIFCKGAPLVDNEIYNGTKARKDMSDEDDILEDLDLTFTLQSTATTGYVTFIVTVNERATDYTVFINNVSSFAVTENYTTNKTGTEVVYVEDYKNFTNTNVFQYARLMTYQFRPGISTSATYYLRFEADNKIPFVKEVRVTQESINSSATIDLGDSYVGYAFEGAYATASAAQQGTARITQELFAITPYIHNRINLTYMGYGISDKVYKIALQKQGTDTYAAMEDISIKYNNEETENYIIGYVSTSSAISSETVTKTDYVYRLQVAFEFSSEYDPRSGLQELSAGTTYNLFDNAHSFGFKNARTGNYYSAETVVEDGSITLQLYGYADNKFADNREILEKYSYLLGDLYTFESLQELLKPSSRTEIDQPFTDPTYNYLVTVADNGLRRFELQAQGATNEGNYVLVKLSFASMFGGEPVQKDIDLLIKINPSYDIKYMVNDDAQTATRSALDIYNTSTGPTSKLIASNYDPQNLLGEYYRVNHPKINESASDGSKTQFIYNKENKNKSIIVINKKVGSETGISDIFYTNEFVYKLVMNDGIYNNYMEDKEGIELNEAWEYSEVDNPVYTYTGGSEDSISFVMYRPKLGTKYYYIEGEDKWGYVIRLYIAVDPEINPQFINLSAVADTPLAEGRDTIGIGAYYSKVTPISQKQENKDYEYSYQFPKADIDKGAPKVTLHAQIGEIIYHVNVSDAYYDFYIQNKMYESWDSVVSGNIASGTNITLAIPKLKTTDLSTIFAADPESEVKKAFEGNASQINYGAIEVTYDDVVYAPITDITKQQPDTAGSTLAFGIDGLQTYMFDISNDLSMLYTGDRWATKLEDYKITGVRFEKDNRPIGIRIPNEEAKNEEDKKYTENTDGILYKKSFDDAEPIGTEHINSYYYKITEKGIEFGKGAQMNTINLPYFDASAYGVASQMTVQLVVTLKLRTGEEHELRADIVVSKSAAGELSKTDFLDTEVISSESFESQGEGTTPGGGDSEESKVNIYNNTLELEFKEHGKAIEYYVDDHADDDSGASKVVEYATLSNENRDYVHREQLKLITGLSVVDENTKVDLYIKAADENDEPDVRVLYGGKDVSGTYDTEQQAFKYTISIKEFTKQDGSANENIIRLNIEDVSEVEISGYANRTIYSLATDQNIGFAYQQEKVIKVHKIYDSVTASEEAAAGLGYYIVNEYSKLTTNGKDTYIIDPKQWAGTQINNGKIAYTPGVENSDPTDEKFPLGAAPIIANNPYMFTFSAVGATVDANGIITTAEEFDINAASGILVTIYMKVSGADGNFESDESIEIGTVRFRLSQVTSPTEIESVADEIFTEHGAINDSNSIGTFIVKRGEEFKFEERMMDTLKNVGSEQAYRNIQIRIVNENYENEKDGAASAEIIRNNLDKYVYTTEGKYNSRFIISTRDGDSITYLQFVAEVLVYDDSNPEERTLVVDMADLTGDSPKTLKDYLTASGAVYCTEMGVAADVSENGLKIFLQNIESIADLPTGIYDHGFILSQESGFKYVEVRFFIYDSSKDLTAGSGENITIAIGNRSNYRFTNLNKLLENSGVTIQKIYSDDEGTIVDAGESEYFNLSSNFTQDRTYYMLLSDGTLQRAVIKFAIFNVTNDPTAQWWKGEMGEEGEYTGEITAEEIQKILGRNGEVYALDSSTNVMTKITEDGVDTITWTSANEVTKGYIIKSGENYFHHSIRYSRYINTLELTEILDTYNPLYNLSQLDTTVKSALSLGSGVLTWRDADLHDRPTVALDAIEFAAAENRVITIVSYIRNGGEYYQVTIHFAYGGDHKIHFNPTFEEGTETRTLAELDSQLLAEEEAKGLTGEVTWYVNSQECKEIKISDFVGKQVRIGVKIGDVYCVVYIEFTKAE